MKLWLYRRRQREKCQCGGYPFPHRRTGGLCLHSPRREFWLAVHGGATLREAMGLLSADQIERMFPMPKPICKKAQDTGVVPLDCLFNCELDCAGEHERSEPKCRKCGSTDVRWRQQGGKWTLFSLEPGKLHVCARPVPTEFDVL